MQAVLEVGQITGVAPVLAALGLSRATFYRWRRGDDASPRPRPRPDRALDAGERAVVLSTLNSPRFVDLAPAQVVAELLEENQYLCSTRTMYRILAEAEVRLIGKWLKVGVDEAGKNQRSDCGLPQGAVVSPVLANVFLHYVLDLWSQQWRTKEVKGDMIIVRFADVIAGFQYRWEAERFRRELADRLGKFSLQMHPRKTRMIEFGRWAVRNRRQRGQRKPESFDFLGFTHISRYNWQGKFVLTRFTKRSSFQSALQDIKRQLRRRLHDPIGQTGAWLRGAVQGHLNYFAVPGNSRRTCGPS